MKTQSKSALAFLMVLALLTDLGSALRRPGLRAASSPRPNLVVILLDDQDDLTSPYWSALKKTEALVRNRGLTFNRAYSPDPICCPARSVLLTGLYPHNTGVLANQGPYGGWEAFVSPLSPDGRPIVDSEGNAVDNEDRTLAVLLSRAGYRTALFGKYLNGAPEDLPYVPKGWTEWYAGDHDFYQGYDYKLTEKTGQAAARFVSYGHEESDYSTDVIAGKAAGFIRRSKGESDAPLFLWVAPTAPHLPLEAPARYQSAQATWSGRLPKRPNYNEADLSDKPAWLRNSGDFRSQVIEGKSPLSAVFSPTVEFPKRMGSLYAVDDMVAQIASELDRAGELENTYFVFTSDNGYNLGAHRLANKMAPYEESIKIPLVISGPGVRHGDTEALTLQTDLAPTFLEVAGVPAPDYLDGRSLVSRFSKLDADLPASGLHSEFVTQYLGFYDSLSVEIPAKLGWVLTQTVSMDNPTYQQIHTGRHVFIRWQDRVGKERELYDLASDPYQLKNRLKGAVSIADAQLAASLERRLDQHLKCSGGTCP